MIRGKMQKKVEKVLAYITRKTAGRTELLVFEHKDFPEAGFQIPAGTVDPEEIPEQAVLREILEESGLAFTHCGRRIGRFEWFHQDRNELHFRNVFQLTGTAQMKDEWLHIVSGKGGDENLVFRYRWIPIQKAQEILAADQGAYLSQLA